MIRSGQAYRHSLQDARVVYTDGAPFEDVTQDPRFAPAVDLRAKIQDMQLAADTRPTLVCSQDGEDVPVPAALPFSQSDWWAKRRASDLMLDAARGIAFRIDDDTIGEVWSLGDAKEKLNAINPQSAPGLKRLIKGTVHDNAFMVTGNTDPKGDWTCPPTGQASDMALRVVRETDAGIVVRGAKFETAATYTNRACTKPTITNCMSGDQSEHAVAFMCNLSSAVLKFLCRSSHISRNPATDPLTARLDEIEALVIFEDALLPGEEVIFYHHTRSALLDRTGLHRYCAFAFLQRGLRLMDLLIGTLLLQLRQAGLDDQKPVQDRLGELACFRECLNADQTSAVTLADRSLSGLMMPNQSLLYAGHKMMTTGIHHLVQIARELCGGQIDTTPDASNFAQTDIGSWLQALHLPEAEALIEGRCKLFTFAQAPAYAQSAALYHNFGWEGPLAMVREFTDLGERPEDNRPEKLSDNAISKWFSQSRAADKPHLKN